MTAAIRPSDELRGWDVDGPIPERLPLVDALVGQHAVALDGARFVLVQHQTGSIVPMVKALMALGARRESIFFVDIPYSTHPAVTRALLELGVPPGNFAAGEYQLDLPFAAFQVDRTERLLRRVLGHERVLVLDDGAYGLEALSRQAEVSADVVAVEQTVFGMRKLREDRGIRAYAQSIPVVNVAESAPKKRDEAAFLGSAITSALARSYPAAPDRMRTGRTLLLGFGAIGAAVAASLVNELGIEPSRINVSDPLLTATEQARSHGFSLWSDQDASVDVLIGCSGRRSFRPHDARILRDGALLVSASSGAIELSRDKLFELAASDDCGDVAFIEPEPLARRSLHEHIRLRLFGRDVMLVNSGFPVDFDGTLNGVPSRLIQLTRALMLAGAIQAHSETRRGIVELRDDLATWISRRFGELISGSRAHSRSRCPDCPTPVPGKGRHGPDHR